MERKLCEETVNKIDEAGDIARKEGSGRAEENIELIEEGNHSTSGEITRELSINRRSSVP